MTPEQAWDLMETELPGSSAPAPVKQWHAPVLSVFDAALAGHGSAHHADGGPSPSDSLS